MQDVRIGDVTGTIKTWDPRTTGIGTLSYIDIGSIDRDTKTIPEVTEIDCSEAPSRARQLVTTGDILVATVRPNLNAVAVVPTSLDGATASTGFCILRPTAKVLSSYLFHWTRSPYFISEMTGRATGQSYPAVSDRIIRNSLIPLPASIEEQRKIVEILERVDELRANRRQVFVLLNDLAQSIFFEDFGNLITNDRSWKTGRVADIISRFETGKSITEGEDEDSPYRILKISSITSGVFKSKESKPAPTEYMPAVSHFVKGGDLLFSRANTAELIGATAIVPDVPHTLLMPDKIWRFVWINPDDAQPLFVHYLFRQPSFRDIIRRDATGTSGSMKNISQEKVLAIPIGIPPVEARAAFAVKVQELEELRQQAQRQAAQLDELSASLRARAFRNEL